MEATFLVKKSELTPDFLEVLKNIEGSEYLHITATPSKLYKKETKEEYLERIDKAIDNIENGSRIEFTEEQFETFVNKYR
jgi:hypothetical protein